MIPNKGSIDKIRIPEYIYVRTGYMESCVMVPRVLFINPVILLVITLDSLPLKL